MTAAPDYAIPQPGEVVSLEAAFIDLARVTARFSEDVPLYLDSNDSPEAALLLLHDLREARKALASIEAFVEAEASDRMPRREFRWSGFVAELKGGQDRKAWRHDDVAWAIVHPLTVDPMTGEVDRAAAELVGKARDALINCAQITGWRVTQLRPLGIDPSNYCETTTGRRTVHVRRDVDEAGTDDE